MFKILRDQKGNMTAEVIVIVPVIFLLFALFFDPIIQEVQIISGEKISSYYLGRIRVEGCLTSDDKKAMVEEFKQHGMDVVEIDAPEFPIYRDNQSGNSVFIAVKARSEIRNIVPSFFGHPEYSEMTFYKQTTSEKVGG